MNGFQHFRFFSMQTRTKSALLIAALFLTSGCTRLSERNSQTTQVDGRGWGGADPVAVALQAAVRTAGKAVKFLRLDGDPDRTLCQKIYLADEYLGNNGSGPLRTYLNEHYLNASAFSAQNAIFENWTLEVSPIGSQWSYGSNLAHAETGSHTLTFDRAKVSALSSPQILEAVLGETLRASGLPPVPISPLPPGAEDYALAGRCEATHAQAIEGSLQPLHHDVVFNDVFAMDSTLRPEWVGLAGDACGFSIAEYLLTPGAPMQSCRLNLEKLHNIDLLIKGTGLGSLKVAFRLQSDGSRYEVLISPAGVEARYVDAAGNTKTLGVIAAGPNPVSLSIGIGMHGPNLLIYKEGSAQTIGVSDDHIELAGGIQFSLDTSLYQVTVKR